MATNIEVSQSELKILQKANEIIFKKLGIASENKKPSKRQLENKFKDKMKK